MTIIYLLLICSILIALVFLSGFLWSVRAGQYDDTETPAMRMLLEDAPPAPAKMEDDHHQDLP